MIDVFVRVWPQSKVRAHLASAVLERLAMMGDEVRVVGIYCFAMAANEYAIHLGPGNLVGLHADDFARRSRQVADEMARSPIYVVIDDDHLPIGKDWIHAGVEALERRPEYAMLSAWSINGEVHAPAGEDDVFDTVSSGTPCFVRKGTFAGPLPDGAAAQYDSILSTHLLATRGRLGFLRFVRYNHLGIGLSQVVEGHWQA